MNCPVCNKKNNEEASFCSHCGEPLNDGAERKPHGKPSKPLNLAKLLAMLSVAFIISIVYHLYAKYHYRVNDYSHEMVVELKKTGEMEYVLGYGDPMEFYFSGSSGNEREEVENKALMKHEEKMNRGVRVSGVLCFLALVGRYYLRRRDNAALKVE